MLVAGVLAGGLLVEGVFVCFENPLFLAESGPRHVLTAHSMKRLQAVTVFSARMLRQNEDMSTILQSITKELATCRVE